MQAVILAGGKGTRLATRLHGRPKPLVPVGGVPLLERQIVQLAAKGVTEAVILVSHEAAQIAAFLSSSNFKCRTVLIDDGEPRGTAGAVLACLDHLAPTFLVVYGDTLFDIDVEAMLTRHRATMAEATLLVHPNDHPEDSDLLEVDGTGCVIAFHSHPHPPTALLANIVNAAFYLVERSLMTRYRDNPVPSDFARDFFPRALKNGHRIHGYRSYEYIKDLGTPTRLDKVERHLATGVVARARRSEPQRAVFVDRDGTLNHLLDYVRCPADLRLLPHVGDGVRRLNEAERRVVVVTNQPVLARGECSFEGMRNIHAKLETDLGRHGGYLDAIYVCPHHPKRGFPGEIAALKVECDCRKPNAGMLERAIFEMNIDRDGSFLIGDSVRDVKAARKAGILSVRVCTGENDLSETIVDTPDFTVLDFSSAVALIIDWHPRALNAVAPLAAAIAAGDLILIDGLARSGKSTAASILATSLRSRGLKAFVLSLDMQSGATEDQKRDQGEHTDIGRSVAHWLKHPYTPAGRSDAIPPQIPKLALVPTEFHLDAVLILEGLDASRLAQKSLRTTHCIHIEVCEEERQKRLGVDPCPRRTPKRALFSDLILIDDVAQCSASGQYSSHALTLTTYRAVDTASE
jgi:histidinol-phosphate phosphatase family protein